MKKINEELEYMKYLFGYERGVVISEQKLLKEDPMLKVDPKKDSTYTDDKPRKHVKGTIGFEYGKKDFDWLGRTRSSGGVQLGFEYDREADKHLNTASDVLQKMQNELSNDKDFANLPNEYKVNLANGFFNAITTLIGNQKFEKIDKKVLRKIRRFFRKSQRWKFSIGNTPKVKVGNKNINTSNLKIQMSSSAELDSIKQIESEIEEHIKICNENNFKPEIILGDEASVLIFENSTGEYGIDPTPKNRLSTFFSHIAREIDTKNVKKKGDSFGSVSIDPIDIGRVSTNYDPGKDDPSAFLQDVMKQIYSKVGEQKATFRTEDENGKTIEKTMTVNEMIACGTNRCPETFKISLYSMEVAGSASNTWAAGETLDFTHNNKGEKVKDATELSSKGNNLKNFNLSKRRADKLAQVVASEFEKNPNFEIADELLSTDRIKMDYRVTDTNGMIDSEAVKQGLNPGQYAEFKIDLLINVYYRDYEPAVNLLDGEIHQKMVSLSYTGKKAGNFDLSLDITLPKTSKSVYLRGRGSGNPRGFLPPWLSNIRYNMNQRTMGGSDRRSIFRNYRLP